MKSQGAYAHKHIYIYSLDKTIRKIQSLNEADQKLGIRKDVDMAQEGITFTQYEEIAIFSSKKVMLIVGFSLQWSLI